jgi:hypothetical protein
MWHYHLCRMSETCFICLEGDEKIIAACRCKGGVQHVHHRCLVRWMATGRTSCTVCLQRYRSEPGLTDHMRRSSRERGEYLAEVAAISIMLILWIGAISVE